MAKASHLDFCALSSLEVHRWLSLPFSLGLDGALSATRTTATSLASVSGDTSSYCASSSSFTIFPFSAGFLSAASDFVFSSACLVSAFLVAIFF